jgi:large subunit ribosomal protein L4
MAKIKVYNLEGKENGKMTVSDSVFGLKQNDDLVHQVYVTIAANKRQVLSHTKNRGERAGSGVKPWKQKGTGRARVGSVRSPLWKKGGIVFGPTKDKNFKKNINKKMKEKAIRIVLSGKFSSGEIVVLDKLELKENKTKFFAKALKNLKMNGRTLISFSDKEKDMRIFSRNIEKVENTLTSQINVFDMLNNKNLVLSQDSVKYLEEKYKD